MAVVAICGSHADLFDVCEELIPRLKDIELNGAPFDAAAFQIEPPPGVQPRPFNP